jgi:hypothetical protein
MSAMRLVRAASMMVAAGLAGCATQAELRAQGGARSWDSPRPVAAVSECLADRLAGLRQLGLPYPPPTVSPRGAGWTYSWPSRAAGRLFLDLDPREGGSRLTFHQGLPMDGPPAIGDAAAACAAA